MADDYESERPDAHEEGGPVKSFLEHLEDFRWVLVKSSVTLAVAMLLCLVAGNYAVGVLKWPLTQAKVRYSNTNQIAIVNFGTNLLGNFQLSEEQQKLLSLGTNRFEVVQIAPVIIGTNQVLGWNVVEDPDAVASAQRRCTDSSSRPK